MGKNYCNQCLLDIGKMSKKLEVVQERECSTDGRKSSSVMSCCQCSQKCSEIIRCLYCHSIVLGNDIAKKKSKCLNVQGTMNGEV